MTESFQGHSALFQKVFFVHITLTGDKIIKPL